MVFAVRIEKSDSPRETRYRRFEKFRVSIGRSPLNDVVLNELDVSDFHAEVEIVDREHCCNDIENPNAAAILSNKETGTHKYLCYNEKFQIGCFSLELIKEPRVENQEEKTSRTQNPKIGPLFLLSTIAASFVVPTRLIGSNQWDYLRYFTLVLLPVCFDFYLRGILDVEHFGGIFRDVILVMGFLTTGVWAITTVTRTTSQFHTIQNHYYKLVFIALFPMYFVGDVVGEFLWLFVLFVSLGTTAFKSIRRPIRVRTHVLLAVLLMLLALLITRLYANYSRTSKSPNLSLGLFLPSIISGTEVKAENEIKILVDDMANSADSVKRKIDAP